MCFALHKSPEIPGFPVHTNCMLSTAFHIVVLSVVSVAGKKNIYPNNKKEIYNDRYKHTRDRLFGLALMVHILQSTGNIISDTMT